MARRTLAAALLLAALTVASAQGATPATCSVRGQYRTPGGCKPCVSRESPYTKLYGGVLCYTPTTLSKRSTFCSNLVLPAFVRNEKHPSAVTSCIPSSQRTINLFLVTKSSQASFLNAGSYIGQSLRLADSIAPRHLTDGQPIYVKAGSRLLVEFQDNSGALNKRRGQTVQLTGVLVRGSDLIPYCFVSYLRVCK